MMQISCTICTDLVEPDENLHATRCGHVFHNHCLSDWIERSSTCPQCRRVVTDNCLLRIYPTFSEDKDITSLQSRLHHTLELYKELETACVEKEELLKKAGDDLKKNEESLEIYMSELDSRNSALEALKHQLETVGTQHVDVQRLEDENAALKATMGILNGEIQRQNYLYSEFMAQISIQRNSLNTYRKEAAQLRGENVALKNNLRTLNGDLRKLKSLYDELRTQVSLQKDQTSNPDSQSTEQKDVLDCLKAIEDCPKITLNRANKVEPNKIKPPESLPAQSLDTAYIVEKMNVLSQKLSLAKSSHTKLSKTLVNLTVAWLKLKVTTINETNLLSTASQNTYENDLITRPFKTLSIHGAKFIINNNLNEKDSKKTLIEISAEIGSLLKPEQSGNTIKTVPENDLKKICDFFTKIGERETQLEKISKEEAKRHSLVSSAIEDPWPHDVQNYFLNALQKVVVSDALKNYQNNFKSFNIGVLNVKRSSKHVKNNTGRSYAKEKNSVTKEAFEFDATRTYRARNVGRKSVFTFEARRLPLPPPPPVPAMPPMPSELKKAANMHISCTICIDPVGVNEELQSTKCGHLFHHHCLSDWMQRSSTCPQCRKEVTVHTLIRIYPTFSDEEDREVTSLKTSLNQALQELSELQAVCDEKEHRLIIIGEDCEKKENSLKKANEDCIEKESRLKKVSETLKINEESLEEFASELDSRNAEVEDLKIRLDSVEIEKNNEIRRSNDEIESLKEIVRTLNGEIQQQKERLESQSTDIEQLQKENESLRHEKDTLNGEIQQQKERLESQSTDIEQLQKENESLRNEKETLSGEIRRLNIRNEELMIQISLLEDGLFDESHEINGMKSQNDGLMSKDQDDQEDGLKSRERDSTNAQTDEGLKSQEDCPTSQAQNGLKAQEDSLKSQETDGTNSQGEHGVNSQKEGLISQHQNGEEEAGRTSQESDDKNSQRENSIECNIQQNVLKAQEVNDINEQDSLTSQERNGLTKEEDYLKSQETDDLQSLETDGLPSQNIMALNLEEEDSLNSQKEYVLTSLVQTGNKQEEDGLKTQVSNDMDFLIPDGLESTENISLTSQVISAQNPQEKDSSDSHANCGLFAADNGLETQENNDLKLEEEDLMS